MTTPALTVEFVKAGNYAVQTASGYRLTVERDWYAGGWRIWNIQPGAPEWGTRPYPTKREALDAIRKAFGYEV